MNQYRELLDALNSTIQAGRRLVALTTTKAIQADFAALRRCGYESESELNPLTKYTVPSLTSFWDTFSRTQRLLAEIPPGVLSQVSILCKGWELRTRRILDELAEHVAKTDGCLPDIRSNVLKAYKSEAEFGLVMLLGLADSDLSTWPSLLDELQQRRLDLQAVRDSAFPAGWLDGDAPQPQGAASAGGVGEPQDPAAGEHHDYLVTLQQAAAMVSRSKKTLERRKTDSKFPTPRVAGGGGKPDEYAWSEMRLYLEREFDRKMPEHFPTALFVRS